MPAAIKQTVPQDVWANDLYDYLRTQGIEYFCYVPDGGHRVLIDRSIADPTVRSVVLTTEEEGVAFCAGVDLGGKRSVLLMQSSGSGNCINMLSLITGGRFPFLSFVTMRGDFGESNPWQYPMGRAVRTTLEAVGVICISVESADDVIPAAEAAISMAFKAGRAVAVLLTQRLLGAKEM